HEPVLAETDPVVGADLRLILLAARDRHEDAVRQRRRDLCRCARVQEHDDVLGLCLRGHLRPGRPESGGEAHCPDASLRGAQTADEEVLPFPTAVAGRAPVDRRRRVGLDDVETSADKNGRGAGGQVALREALEGDRTRLPAAVRPEGHQAEEGLARFSLNGIGDRGAAACVESEAGRTETAPSRRPCDRRQATAAGEDDPAALPVLDENVHVPMRTFSDLDPGERDPAVSGQPAEADRRPAALAATERRVETAPDRIRHPGRSVRRYGKHAPIGLLGDDLGLRRGGERQDGQEPDPRRLDITQVSVHSHKSVDLGRECRSGSAGYVLQVRLIPKRRRERTMKFLMLVCWDAEKMDAQTEPESSKDAADDESFPWLDDLQARGIWVTGDQLAPPRRARTVRVRDGKTIVTDGP